MKTYYKLTDQDMQTKNNFQWELNKIYRIEEINKHKPLCTEYWFHVYSSPLLAILLNPIHANISNPRLFKCICKGLHKTDRGLKEGFTQVELTEELKLPEIISNQKIAFGILCAKEVYKEGSWNRWADNWLNNIDRNKGVTCIDAYGSAYVATYAAYTTYAAHAAYAAARAAYAAARAAYATYAAYTVHAAYAADAATDAANINLTKIAKKAMKY